MRSWIPLFGGCARYEALLTPFSEDALPARTAARVQAHLAACAACREDLATAQAVGRLLRDHKPSGPEPAADLWSRIYAEIAPTRINLLPETARSAPPRRRAAGWRPALAAPVAALAAGVLAFALVTPRPQTPTGREDRSMTVAQLPRRPVEPAAPLVSAPDTPRPDRSGKEIAKKPSVLPPKPAADSGFDPFESIEARRERGKPARVAAAPPRPAKRQKPGRVLVAQGPRPADEPSLSAPPSPKLLETPDAFRPEEGSSARVPVAPTAPVPLTPDETPEGISPSRGVTLTFSPPGAAHADSAREASRGLPARSGVPPAQEVPASASAVDKALEERRQFNLFVYRPR